MMTTKLAFADDVQLEVKCSGIELWVVLEVLVDLVVQSFVWTGAATE